MPDLFDAAPDAKQNALKEAASILHTRIALSVIEFFKTLTKTQSQEDAKNCAVSAQISALGEIVVAWRLDPDYIVNVFHEQVNRLRKPITLTDVNETRDWSDSI